MHDVDGLCMVEALSINLFNDLVFGQLDEAVELRTVPGHACAFNCQDDIVHLFLDLFDGGSMVRFAIEARLGSGEPRLAILESLAK